MVVLLAGFALAGCVGSSDTGGPADTETTSGEPDADGDGATGNDPGSDPGSDDGTTDSDNRTDGSKDEPARTPSDAMEVEPEQTGEGWAKFTVTGQASLAVDSQVLFSFFGSEDEFPIRIQGDETLIEILLTWDSEYADLDCRIAGQSGGAACTNHGMPFQENLNPIPVFQETNGSQAEYAAITLDRLPFDDEDYPVDTEIVVWEDEVWEPEAAPGEADSSQGLSYTVEVWVYTVPTEPAHDPFQQG